MSRQDGRRRVVIEAIQPQIDCGGFALKRIVGDTVVVEADVFADGHDELGAVLVWRREAPRTQNIREVKDAKEANDENHVTMEALGNDRWRASFPVIEVGRYHYRVRGYVDAFATWQSKLRKRVQAGQDVSVELLIGAGLVEAAAKRATGADAESLIWWAEQLDAPEVGTEPARHAFDEELTALMAAYPDTSLEATSDELTVVVDRTRARFGAWYELFPRSTAEADPSGKPRHGTFADVERRLPYIAGMGFDIVYLPPIHPIGTSHRKGRNNATTAAAGDPGSPWAIGSREGGHTAIHPQLGTLADFDKLVASTQRFGMEIALDFAIQASPDHPWVHDHPEWFRRRPDGTLQYAENPPKRYEDIYPIDFETEAWRELWDALKEVVDFWIGHGVRIFRVDNPHTKAFAFWEWLISGVKAAHPDVLFLAEAFTRPKVMYRLAKLGFSQSYTYFTWRSTKAELTEYLTELTTPPVSDFFRPNFWPNTPDILAQQLQAGGRPGFIARLILAGTLSGAYGIYGPSFELGENTPAKPGSEEYVNSEKYEIRTWDLRRMDSLSELIAALNRSRRQHPALQGAAPPVFHPVGNDALIAYSKATPDRSSVVLVVVNLDPHNAQWGWVDLPLAQLCLPEYDPYPVEDLLTGSRYTWNGPRNYVRLDPAILPAHILALRQPERPEHQPERPEHQPEPSEASGSERLGEPGATPGDPPGRPGPIPQATGNGRAPGRA